MIRWLIPDRGPVGTFSFRSSLLAAAVALVVLGAGGPAGAVNFRRGDANGDGTLDLGDALHTLFYRFAGGAVPDCLDAADANDDGKVDLTDAVATLSYLFLSGPNLAAPGPGACGADLTSDSLSCASYPSCPPDNDDLRRIGHLLNRAAYGPTFEEVQRILSMGTAAWIEEQLAPDSVDDSALSARVTPLTEQLMRSDDRTLIASGQEWRYMKGTAAPPATWRMPDFEDSGWSVGYSSFGYDNNVMYAITTSLDDMFNKYTSVFIRHKFMMSDADLAALNSLVLSVDYDDAFVAYLNGYEVARRNIAGTPPAYTAVATTNIESTGFVDIDITTFKARLVSGVNVLSVQAHNSALNSSDFILNVELLNRKVIPGGTTTEIKGINELKALAHVYSIYSRRQLRSVLGEFWENHFTTDYNKVATYLDSLSNSDASKAMSTAEAQKEAARLEHHEYEFLRQHALGDFGDLLRYSATSPTMLIYLDNILNVKASANENYAREIMELHTLGADNGYVQVDIEQLAKCFTGWGVCKVAPENAGDPTTPYCGVQYTDQKILVRGPTAGNWWYYKGTVEPDPAWKTQAFTPSAAAGWLQGACSIGYGDNDDATVLSDMQYVAGVRPGYTTVYLRKAITIADPAALHNLILSVDVDDGFVAYLNGTEVARYYAPGGAGSMVPFDAVATQLHSAAVEGGGLLEYNLNRYRGLLVPGTNTLAIQVLNYSKESTDLTINPALFDREVLPGSIENGDPNAVWAFHFFPNLHNSTESKTLFKATPYQLVINPGGGLQDAQSAIDKIVSHPSTATFVCSKLIQRFVGDEIDFRNPAAGPYAALLGKCLTAWGSTTNPPSQKGNIAKVMRAIFTSTEFWSEGARRSKVKTGFEYIASTVRVLGAQTNGVAVVDDLMAMGMEYFTRMEPDGWPEVGSELIDTGGVLSRMKFAQALSEGSAASTPDLYWNAATFLSAHGINSADKFVDFFNELLFQGTLTSADRALVMDFTSTNDLNQPVPFSVLQAQRGLGLMLSLPQWQYQ